MTIRIAHAKLVEIIEAVTPISRSLGLPASFEVTEVVSEEMLSGDRQVLIRLNEDADAGLLGPYTADLSGQPRLVVPARVAVAYPDYDDDGELNLVIEEDRRELTRALLQPSNWGSSTTGICWLNTDELLLPARREIVDGAGGRRVLLIFRFVMTYR